MARSEASAAVSVERFFQFSLLGLVASGYLAVAGSGYLDSATIILTAAGLLLRGLLIGGFLNFEISERAATLLAISYVGFFGIDYLFLSRDFLTATVHLVFFLAVMKILTARTNRDYLYTAAIAFLELLAAAILSVDFNFFLFLALYLLFAMAALTSGEIRRSMHKSASTARGGCERFHPRLALLSTLVTLGILALTGGLFFLLPRTADAAFSRFLSHRIYLPGFSNQVTLGEIGEIKTTSRPILHVAVFSREAPAGLKWRGAALTDFDGKRWSNPHPQDEMIRVENGQADLRPPGPLRAGRRLNYHVELNAVDTNALFFAGTPEKLSLRQEFVTRNDTGGYRLTRLPPPGFGYDAYSLLEDAPESAPAADPFTVLALEARALPATAASRSPDCRTGPRHGRPCPYRPRTRPRRGAPSAPRFWLYAGASRPRSGRSAGRLPVYAQKGILRVFCLGHDDHAAHARHSRAPGHGFSERRLQSCLGVVAGARLGCAHLGGSLDPGHGWTTFDPTPPDPNPQGFSLLTRLGLYVDAAQTFWQEWVVSYDLAQQGTLSYRMELGARRLGIRWFDSLADLQTDWRTYVRSGSAVTVWECCLR